MKHWNLESLPWNLFDPSKVKASLLAQAKGAALVESNAADYVAYLRQVFAGDEAILHDIEIWGEEERLHGAALRRWCEMADAAYNYDESMERFLGAFRVPLKVETSIRGSKARELVARCVVETGTATYYTALRDACEEPVLKEICRRIAGDEVRHFNLFLKYLNGRYAEEENLSLVSRLKTILERVKEAEDIELTFAYFAANHGAAFDPAKFPEYSRQYMAEAVGFYQSKHFQALAPMLGKAAGFRLRPWMASSLGHVVHKTFRYKYADASV